MLKEIRIAVNFQPCTNKAFNFSVEIVLHMIYQFVIERIDFVQCAVLIHFFVALELGTKASCLKYHHIFDKPRLHTTTIAKLMWRFY